MAQHCLRTSSQVTAFATLLHLKLAEIIGCEDLHAEDLHRLRHPDVVRGLASLSPFITALCNLPETLPPSGYSEDSLKIGLVFGSNFWEPVIARAAELYRSGAITHLIVSGHQSKRLSKPEGVLMREYLIEQGVPAHHILTDVFATNTGENATNVVQVYCENFWRTWPPAVLVAKNYHTARAFTALHEQFLEVSGETTRLPELYLGVAELPQHQADSWLNHPQSVEQIVGEVFRLRRHHVSVVRVNCVDRIWVESLLPKLTGFTL